MASARATANEVLKRHVRQAYRLAWASATVLMLPVGEALAAKGPTPTPREVFELAPVWQLDIAEDTLGLTPRVVVNAFADGRSRTAFPIPELPLRHFASRVLATYRDHVSLSMSTEVARLRVRSDGRLESRAPIFEPSSQIFVDPLTGRVTSLMLADTYGQQLVTLPGDPRVIPRFHGRLS